MSSSSVPDRASPSTAPDIWALMAEKPGDNAQIEAVAEAIGLPWRIRRFAMAERWSVAKPAIAADISHLDIEASERLEPPWPDLIVTSGRRLFNVALWIKARSPRTRLVLVGRPHGHYEGCDLIVAPPQYRLPPRANIVTLGLPLLFPSRQRIAEESRAWSANLAAMSRPLTAVLVGAQTRPFRFAPADADRMMRRIATATGGEGSLFVTTSRRTPADVADAIAARLRPQDRMFRWQADAPRNPYFALLGTADRFVATGDSASMIVEVARLGRPLAIHELPPDLRPGRWIRHAKRAVEGLARALLGEANAAPVLRAIGLARGRDMTALHRTLYCSGRAVRLGRPFPAPRDAAQDDEIVGIGARIRALLAQR